MVKENSNSKIEKETKKITEELLKLLGFKLEAKVSASERIAVEVLGDDLGLLIGSNGEHLENIQTILGIMVNKKLGGDWRGIDLDIGGWRKIREEDLRSLFTKEVSKLDSSNSEVQLPPMPPSQRRVIHLIASENSEIKSNSEGEEPYRRVVLKRVGNAED